jgi:phytoene desaturase
MRIVVIGAGVGGLTCAARLAAAGHRVTLFEASARVGGKLGLYVHHTPQGTFRFDTGPSLLTLPVLFDDLPLQPVQLDPVVRHVFADGTVLDSTSEGFADRIRTVLGAGAAADWERLWRRAERVWSVSDRYVLRSTVDPVALLRLGWRLPDLAAVAPLTSLRRLGRRYLSDPHLRMFLDRYATYAGSDPRRAPAALLAIPYAELTFGGWYLPGGIATLADALLGRCTELVVPVHLETPVQRILTSGGRITGVRLADGTAIAADAVVANADAATVYTDLWPSPRRARRLARRSLSGFMLLLGLRGCTAGLAHHTVFFPPDYDAEFDAIFTGAGRPVPDPAVYITAPNDPAMRPDGYEAWSVLVNAPAQSPTMDWREPWRASAYADEVLAVLARRGLDVRDRVLFRHVRTPADLERDTGTPGGAIYGTPRHGPAGLLRPANRGPVAGLYLVGGSTHPGGGLPMVIRSAEIVAGLIHNGR